MRHLRKRVVLIHELRQLARAEEFLDRSRNRLRIDHFLRHQAFGFRKRESLFNRSFNSDQTNAEGILGHLTDTAYAAIAEVIDVIDRSVTVSNIDQRLQDRKNIFLAQRAFAEHFFTANAAIELHSADCGQVVPVRIEEQILEQVFGRFLCRRLTRTHHPVYLDERFQAGRGRIDVQGVRNVRPTIEVVHIQALYVLEYQYL